METKKLSKNARKKLRKKEKKKQQREEPRDEEPQSEAPSSSEEPVDIEYVSVQYEDDESSGAVLKEFEDVFKRFASAELLTQPAESRPQTESKDDEDEEEEAYFQGPSSAKQKEEAAQAAVLSRRKRKLLSRMSVAELKQVVARPEAVEAHDVTASDPRLLVHLKSYRNAVPVPRHWCHKRRYLQGKRGVEKRPFALPEFIAQTGTFFLYFFLKKKTMTNRTASKTVIPVLVLSVVPKWRCLEIRGC